jgi:hypothetical protein
MQYAPSTPLIGQNLTADYWQTQLNTVRQLADGAVIWGGWTMTTTAPYMYQQTWDDTAPWWQVTKDFLLA